MKKWIVGSFVGSWLVFIFGLSRFLCCLFSMRMISMKLVM